MGGGLRSGIWEKKKSEKEMEKGGVKEDRAITSYHSSDSVFLIHQLWEKSWRILLSFHSGSASSHLLSQHESHLFVHNRTVSLIREYFSLSSSLPDMICPSFPRTGSASPSSQQE